MTTSVDLPSGGHVDPAREDNGYYGNDIYVLMRSRTSCLIQWAALGERIHLFAIISTAKYHTSQILDATGAIVVVATLLVAPRRKEYDFFIQKFHLFARFY